MHKMTTRGEPYGHGWGVKIEQVRENEHTSDEKEPEEEDARNARA